VVDDLDEDYLELIDLAEDARRELLALPLDVRARFFAAFRSLAAHPTRRTQDLDVRQLHDRRGTMTRYWRLKVPGGYRAIYRVVHGRVRIDAFRPRPSVYSWLSKILEHRR
jgi:mRNA-degrading endonuclease RelE of RelBE toxin-antitoxin system